MSEYLKPHDVREFFGDMVKAMGPEGCLPTPGMERQVNMLAQIAIDYAALHALLQKERAE